MMGMFSKIIFISVLILFLSLALHEYSPQLLMPMMANPSIRHLTNYVHKVIKNPGSIFFEELKTEKHFPTNNPVKSLMDRLFTTDELWMYSGKEGSKGLLLSILGLVFNVKKGKQHYGPEGGYGFFSGRDGSRAFVTGDFSEEGLTDDISGLTTQDYIGLDDWVKFYKKDYKYVGKLIGRYYDSKGNPTQYNLEAQKWIEEAYSQKESENQQKKLFPPCNSEWYPETGSRVYCSQKSGGLERDWVGVPRKVIKPGNTRPVCGCVKNFGPPSNNPDQNSHENRGDLDHPHLKEFTGCKPDSESCKVIEED